MADLPDPMPPALETGEVVGPAAPAPPADPETTGHPAVDAALAELARLAGAPPATQVPALQTTHRVLQETLASIDEQ